MRAWAFMLGGMLVWAAHFFTLYAIASLFLTTSLARALTLIVTLVCLAAGALVLASALRARRRAHDTAARWRYGLAALFASLALIAIAWQGLPAMLL